MAGQRKAGPSSYFDPARIDTLDPRTAELVRRRTDALGPAYRLFYEQPVQIVRGAGVHLYDADGVDVARKIELVLDTLSSEHGYWLDTGILALD